MKKFYFMILFPVALLAQEPVNNIQDVQSWPDASRTAARDMIAKYGTPDSAGPKLLVWLDRGYWRRIEVSKNDVTHNFPIDHTDMLEQCISYKVAADKIDELAAFSGSLVYHKTQGLLCARCDKEANNLLSLNLANEVVTGMKTAEEARKEFGNAVRKNMNGANPEYMRKLVFNVQTENRDPDKNTTGLTRGDVEKISKRVAGK